LLVLEELVSGEVNRAEESHWFASGKVLNVARALHHLEIPAAALTFLGGAHGERVEEELRGLQSLRLRVVWTRSPTRVCTTLVVGHGASTTELVENAGAVSDDELLELVAAFREEARRADACVLIGSLPRGCPASLYRDLLEFFQGPVVIDARGPELLEALP
jgi:fructose-1-phosphate kinase PfkB-like protein